MANERLSVAASIYPHLKRVQVSTPEEPRRSVSPLAAAMYPNHVPKAPQPASRPRLTREQAWDWSNVPDDFARSVGLIRIGRR